MAVLSWDYRSCTCICLLVLAHTESSRTPEASCVRCREFERRFRLSLPLSPLPSVVACIVVRFPQGGRYTGSLLRALAWPRYQSARRKDGHRKMNRSLRSKRGFPFPQRPLIWEQNSVDDFKYRQSRNGKPRQGEIEACGTRGQAVIFPFAPMSERCAGKL
jgi:hypothetical protein